MMKFIIVQLLSFIGNFSNVISMQFKTKRNILFCMLMDYICSILCFILVGADSGIFVCIFGLIQTIMEQYNIKYKNIIYFIFGVIIILLCIVTYDGLISIVPVLAFIFYSLMLLEKEENKIRKINILSMTCWLIYNIYYCIYISVIFNIFSLISTIIGIIRYRKVCVNDK